MTMQINDFGTVLLITIKDQDDATVNVSSADAEAKRQITFRRKDGSEITKSLSFDSDGTDGKVEYTFADGDIDITGEWEYQVYLDLTAGEWYSSKAVFTVYPNL